MSCRDSSWILRCTSPPHSITSKIAGSRAPAQVQGWLWLVVMVQACAHLVTAVYGVTVFHVLSLICWLKHLQRDYTWPCIEERWCCVHRRMGGREWHLDFILMEQVSLFKTWLWVYTSLPTRIKCFMYPKEGRSLEVDEFIVLFYCWNTLKKNQSAHPKQENTTPQLAEGCLQLGITSQRQLWQHPRSWGVRTWGITDEEFQEILIFFSCLRKSDVGKKPLSNINVE